MADSIFGAIRRATGRPYAFFGHSMGAVVAYEVARRLQRNGLPGPCRLFVSGRRAPSRHRAESVHRRDDQGLAAELRALGGTDPRWLDDEELLATIVPPVRSDYRMIETYRHAPGPPLDCPVTALTGDGDPYATISEVAAWQEHSTGSFSLRVFKGGHFFLDTYRCEVLDIIASTLDEMLSPAFADGTAARAAAPPRFA